MKRRRLLLIALAAACAPAEQEPSVHVSGPCGPEIRWAPLPEDVQETSGVAASRTHAGVFWTHNDSDGEPVLFAVDSAGDLRGRVRIDGASNRDWEDIAVGPCTPDGDDQCVFIGDIGDNSERRDHVTVYRVPEPDPARDSVSRPADPLHGRYPEEARDAEAVFVSPRGIHLITKGRSGSIELFRLAPPYRPGRTADLAAIQQLAPPPTSVSAQVTAAAASDDGRTIVVRTYAGLRFFTSDADSLRPLGAPADFLGPAQAQGEGADFAAPDRLVLTGEASGRNPASLALLRCDPRASPDSAAPGAGGTGAMGR